MAPDGDTINKYVGDFIKQEVENYLHIQGDVTEAIERRKSRRASATARRWPWHEATRERAKKANLHNRKLRDYCRVHFSDVKDEHQEESSIFITQGDSASGSITKSRDVTTQAVFSLRGKPPQHLRTDQEGGLRERGVQPAAGGPQH